MWCLKWHTRPWTRETQSPFSPISCLRPVMRLLNLPHTAQEFTSFWAFRNADLCACMAFLPCLSRKDNPYTHPSKPAQTLFFSDSLFGVSCTWFYIQHIYCRESLYCSGQEPAVSNQSTWILALPLFSWVTLLVYIEPFCKSVFSFKWEMKIMY